MKNRGEKSSGWMPWVLPVICIVFMMVSAAQSYGHILQSQSSCRSLRGSLSYLRSQVRSRDVYGCIEIREDGGMLVLKDIDSETSEVYEMRIFLKDGNLTEEYAPEGEPVSEDRCVAVTKTSCFSAVIEGSLLKLTTGEGTEYINIFAAGEGVSQ